ncbi:MAG: aminotransferase [Rhodospirillales bacterium]|jgi:putrescine---pyruvate transaminase|nr:aminotransferase [Rhodospirillales bacterium]
MNILSNLGTEQLQEKDNHFIHPWESMKGLGTNKRPIIDRAEGIYYYDTDGTRYIDGPAGMWCVNVGHGRVEIADAIRDQALRMPYCSPWTEGNVPAAVLCAKLAEISPGDLNNVFLTNSGSTAVDSALRFVMFYNNVRGKPEKKHIISRERAYHGSTYLASSACGKERDKSFMDANTELFHFVSDPEHYHRPEGFGDADWLEFLVKEFEDKIAELGADKCAAFIGEPLLASGGVSIPPKGYHKRILDICHANDMLYISDEVVTAWGRLGHFFASEEVFGIKPDMITTAKGLTSGYQPLGALFIADEVMARLKGDDAPDSYFSNGFTYSGHPVACAAALKNIEIMEREKLNEHAREVGAYFQSRLQELRDIPIVGDVRGIGMLGCVECSISSDSRDSLALDHEIGNRINEHCSKLGLFVRPLINMCVFSPPLIITKEEIDIMVDILRKGIELTMEDVRKEGVWKG